MVEEVTHKSDVLDGLLVGGAAERRAAAEQDVGEHADAPDVGLRTDLVALHDLGSCRKKGIDFSKRFDVARRLQALCCFWFF